jgi:hypothetical protein
VGTGHSAGGMVAPMLLSTPETTLTNCTSCSWIADPAKLSPEAARVPALFTLGARPDAFKMLPGIEGNLVPARKQALPWCLGLQWECAHDFANSRALFIPWIQAVAELRIPRPMPPAGSPVVLKELKEDDGWLGDRTTIESNYATIAPAKEFQGDKLLGEAVSAPWQATWEKPARGAHAVLAEYEGADGKPGVSRPALVIVRQAAPVSK